MFNLPQLREKGAKKTVLDYIRAQDLSLPIPREVPVTQAKTGIILRSDHWREFDDFFGIFESVVLARKVSLPTFPHSNTPHINTLQQALDYMHFNL